MKEKVLFTFAMVIFSYLQINAQCVQFSDGLNMELGENASRLGTSTISAGHSALASGYSSTANWSDFVLDRDYDLMTLKEVESYIKENGHLPDVPSAEEVKANGIEVGEMNAILLQKIEELTLYIIELEKKIEELNDEKE